MVGAGLLLETAPGNSHYTSLVDHVHAVEEVRLLALSVSLINELLGEVDPGETVHGSLDLGARNVLHVVEGFSQKLGLGLESAKQLLVFSIILVYAGIGLRAILRWVDHQFNCGLANCVGAKFDGLELEDQRFGLFGEVVGLEVATTEAALSHHAFRHGVEGDQLDRVAVGLAQIVEGLAHGDELGRVLVDVGLVDLVREDHDAVLVAQLDDGGEVLLLHNLASGVSRVDHDDGTGAEALLNRLDYLGFEASSVQAPVLLLLEVVREQLSLVQG